MAAGTAAALSVTSWLSTPGKAGCFTLHKREAAGMCALLVCGQQDVDGSIMLLLRYYGTVKGR